MTVKRSPIPNFEDWYVRVDEIVAFTE